MIGTYDSLWLRALKNEREWRWWAYTFFLHFTPKMRNKKNCNWFLKKMQELLNNGIHQRSCKAISLQILLDYQMHIHSLLHNTLLKEEWNKQLRLVSVLSWQVLCSTDMSATTVMEQLNMMSIKSIWKHAHFSPCHINVIRMNMKSNEYSDSEKLEQRLDAKGSKRQKTGPSFYH